MTFLAPSVDHDTSPTWSPRETRRVHPPSRHAVRAAGASGSGSIGNPDGPASNRVGSAAGAAADEAGGGQGARRGPKLVRPTGRAFRRGVHRRRHALVRGWWSLATGEGPRTLHNPENDRGFTTVSDSAGRRGSRVFDGRARGMDAAVLRQRADCRACGAEAPVDADARRRHGRAGRIVDRWRDLNDTTNVGDIDHRHVWKGPTVGGTGGVQLTHGEMIETYPAPVSSGCVAVLAATRGGRSASDCVGDGRCAKIHLSVAAGVSDGRRGRAADRPDEGGRRRRDHNQLFLPKDLKPGEKRPAIVFVHGGPVRQMLLGYHYMHFYTSPTRSISGSPAAATS